MTPLSPEAVAQMVADREAGTPGPWAYRPDKYDDWGTVKAGRFVLCRVRDPDALGEAIFALHRDKGTDPWEVNARRIARLPDLEAAYLTLAAENATLRAERDEAQSELDDYHASDWPIWAKQIYNALKEFGYRYDHFDGIDLPEDVSEFLRGFPENAASELMEHRDDALQELATLRASEAAAMERITELEAVACSYQAALLRQGIDGSKGPKE